MRKRKKIINIFRNTFFILISLKL